MPFHLSAPYRRRWRILLPLLLLILGCNPTPQPLQGNIITLLGHTDFMQPGTQVSLPILVQDVNSRRPAANVKIDVEIGPDTESARPLFSQRTGADGMTLAQFTVPEDLNDPQQFLIVRSDQAIFANAGHQLSRSAFSQPVYLGPSYSILVSTDKPRYQPGQTLHVRVLVLDKLSLRPAAGQKVRVQIQEPGGIWLSDQTISLSDWGIGSLDMALDERAESGQYRIVASVGAVESVRTVTVEPYTLPRFAIDFAADATYYDIQDTVRARITATYFFGKAVANAQVEVSSLHLPIQTGVTDSAGLLDIEFPIPSYYFDALERGTEKMDLTIKVTDAAGHTEDSSAEVLLTVAPLRLDVVPESGFLRPGIENSVYVEVSRPDGAPVQASLTISASVLAQAQTLETDEFGLAVLHLTPSSTADLPLHITAVSEGVGGRVETEETIQLGATLSPAALLVRPERAEYRVGETIAVEIFASGDVQTVYLDLSKEGRTMDLRALPLRGGQAAVEIPVDGSLLGVLEINGYAVAGNTVISDRRLALINPGDLTVQVGADAEVYRPGDTALLTVQTQVQDQAVPAALGITIVDESLYKVEKMDPGFARTYFLLREEMLKLPYRVTGFAPFDSNVPVPALPGGIRSAANLSLMAAFAQELAADRATALPSGGQSAALTQKISSPLLAATSGWSVKLALSLPLLGFGFWDGRRRLRSNLLMLGMLIGLSLLWASCAAPSQAPAGGVAPAAQAPAGESPFIRMETTATREGSGEEIRLRQYFPETLFWLPETVTDAQGQAQIAVPLADSITTWRVGVVASTQDGLLGSAQSDLRVFQDFFVEPDLPLQYVAGDELDVRVSIFNYLDQPQEIELSVEGGDWLVLDSESAVQILPISANEVTSATIPIRILDSGLHTLRFVAQGAQMSDRVERELRVTPAGREVRLSLDGILARSVDERFDVAPLAAAQEQELTLRLYGSQAARYIPDVAESFYRSECPAFEMGWLAVLKAEYLQMIEQRSPQEEFLTEQYLRRAYGRILRHYDRVNQGFYSGCFLILRGDADVLGSARAFASLTQISKLIPVDPALLEQARNFLQAHQNPDGSWLDRSDNYYWQDDASLARWQTAEVIWLLSEAGFANSELVQKGMTFLADQDWAAEAGRWETGTYLNARLLADPSDAQARDLLVSWMQTGEWGWGAEGHVLAAMRATGFRDEAQELLASLYQPDHYAYQYVHANDVMGMLALIEDARIRTAAPDAEIQVLINEQMVTDFTITPENAALLQSRVITGPLAALISGENLLQLRLRGDHVSYYEAEWRYYIPWQTYRDMQEEQGAIQLDVVYAAQQIKKGELVAVTVTVHNTGEEPTEELLLELALPAGFQALPEDLAQMDAAGEILDYLLIPGQVTMRMEPLAAKSETSLTIHVVADFTGKVLIPTSRIYQLSTPAQMILGGSDGAVSIE